MTWIQTFTGKQFYPLKPRIDNICIEDIAHALSLICRYGGQCNRFYSVAEHSVYVSQHVGSKFKLEGLLHDASEGMGLCDIPKPVKNQIPAYEKHEERLQFAVFKRFGVKQTLWSKMDIKEVDTRILMDERTQLFSKYLPWSSDCNPLGISINCWEPPTAEKIFLEHFNKYI